MDEEIALVSRMVQTGKIEEVVAEGVEAHHFSDESCRTVFEICVDHANLWRHPPSRDAIERELARRQVEFTFRIVDDDVLYLANEFKGAVSYRHAVEKWRDLADSIDDPLQRHRLAEVFAEHARDMALLVPTPRVSRFSDMANRIIVARKEQESGKRPGIDLGFRDVDALVSGIRMTEYVAFIAYTNMGKTQGMIRGAHSSYMQDVLPMFVSLEMESEELYDKWDAMAAGISSKAMRARELKPDDWEKWEIAAQKAKDSSNDIIVIDDLRGSATVDRIAAHAERYSPGLICVDYVSLMEAHREIRSDWERVQYISRSLKRLSRAFRIPVYAAAQCNREAERDGPTLDNIAYSTAIGQDANVVIGFHQIPEWVGIKKVEVRLLKNRGGPKGDFFEMWNRDLMDFAPWSREHEWAGKLLDS